jgi:hypothetical protein
MKRGKMLLAARIADKKDRQNNLVRWLGCFKSVGAPRSFKQLQGDVQFVRTRIAADGTKNGRYSKY